MSEHLKRAAELLESALYHSDAFGESQSPAVRTMHERKAMEDTQFAQAAAAIAQAEAAERQAAAVEKIAALLESTLSAPNFNRRFIGVDVLDKAF